MMPDRKTGDRKEMDGGRMRELCMHLLFTSNRVWKKNTNARTSYALMIKLQLKVGQKCHCFPRYVNPSVNGSI